MQSGLRHSVLQSLKDSYRELGWSEQESKLGCAFFVARTPKLRNHLYFSIVRDDVLGLRLQPTGGISIFQINELKLLVDGPPAGADPISIPTGGAIVLSRLPTQLPLGPDGWLFEPSRLVPEQSKELVGRVANTVAASRLFDRVHDTQTFVEAVEENSIPFLAPARFFDCALWLLGRRDEAKQRALSRKIKIETIAKERGTDIRPMDVQFEERFLTYTIPH